MTLNGRNAPLAEINKNSGAHQKNFNKDKPILSAVKCRPMIVVSRNIRYMRMCIAFRAYYGTARCYAKRGYEIACRLSVCVIFTQVGILNLHGRIA